MIEKGKIAATTLMFLSVTTACRAAAELRVGEHNEILEIYVGEPVGEGRTEVVFELKTMEFYSNQRNYGCIFVNGRIVQIREYNKADSYVRGEVQLPGGDEEIVACAGVVSHAAQVDPHNHAALWQAFVGSAHKPFRGKVKDLPRWWVSNPIREKKRREVPAAPAARSSGGEGGRSGHPFLKPEEIPGKVEEATSPTTGQRARFDAVRGLAISGFTPESAKALAWAACNRDLETGTRGYAGMGLSNFTARMPKELRAAILADLRKTLADERAAMPDGILRTMLAWGDAPYIHEILGDDLAGHSVEIDVLEALPGKEAVQRLWALHEACPRRAAPEHYNRRFRIGQALVRHRDKRGIDILMALLPREAAPGPQYRNNTFDLLAATLGETFGYPSGNYRPALEEAVPRMLAWWQEHREVFTFPAGARPAGR